MGSRFFSNYDGYKITSRFGSRTMNGVTKNHNGIDLVARTNSGGSATDYIAAHTGGKVEEVGYNASAGHFVTIRVCESTAMVYYHLKEKSGLTEGQAVTKGTVLGYMGSTGNSTGAHLHFGIKENGKWIDPEPYLDADYPVEEAAEECTVCLPILKKGDKKAGVEAMQQLLLASGCKMENGGKTYGADGSFGAATEKAVIAYQKGKGLAVTGKCDADTWAKLLGVAV